MRITEPQCLPDFDNDALCNLSYDYSKDEERGIDPYQCMYLNKKVQKPAGLPKILDVAVDQLIDWYNRGMYFHFMIEILNIEGYVKNLHVMRIISDEQARTIFKMFGWRW